MMLKQKPLKQKTQNNKTDIHSDREITDKLSPLAMENKG